MKIRSILVGLALALPAVPQSASSSSDQQWWKNAVIYEIYPRSFGDTNGDGIGDLKGVTQHLDYLKDLGIDGIWLTPFYPSPQVDFGYDIADYSAIDPQYGTMADFDELVAEAKKRGIRIIGDLVLNHTSDQHPWFIASKSSRTNSKADWYVWNNGKGNRQPPNNWQSIFGHSAWQWTPSRNQFYYHAFYKEQPDLNWDNADMKAAIYDMIRFWMKKGVAGFRLDAITHLYEDVDLHENTLMPGFDPYGERNADQKYTDALPKVHEALRELRKVADEVPGTVLIGETYTPTINDLAVMYGKSNDELQLPMDTQLGFLNKRSVPELRKKLNEAETGLNGNLPMLVFSNHDNVRDWDRYADGAHNGQIARLIATLLLTPKATTLMYYGEELGMVTNTPKRKEDVKDPIGRIGWPKEKGRDGERTPMQWNGDTDAGFSTAKKTWLPIPNNYRTVNVATESKDPNSLLNFWKALIHLRKENTLLRDGSFELIDAQNPNVLSYLRKGRNGDAVIVSLNFTSSSQTVDLPTKDHGLKSTTAKVLLSSGFKPGTSQDVRSLQLPAFAYYIGQVD